MFNKCAIFTSFCTVALNFHACWPDGEHQWKSFCSDCCAQKAWDGSCARECDTSLSFWPCLLYEEHWEWPVLSGFIILSNPPPPSHPKKRWWWFLFNGYIMLVNLLYRSSSEESRWHRGQGVTVSTYSSRLLFCPEQRESGELWQPSCHH